MLNDWFEEMEKAEQEYDAREYELAQEYKKGYEQGRADKYQEIITEYMLLTEKQVAEIRADVIGEIATRLEGELTKVMPRDKAMYVMYKVHTVLEQLKEQNK